MPVWRHQRVQPSSNIIRNRSLTFSGLFVLQQNARNRANKQTTKIKMRCRLPHWRGSGGDVADNLFTSVLWCASRNLTMQRTRTRLSHPPTHSSSAASSNANASSSTQHQQQQHRREKNAHANQSSTSFSSFDNHAAGQLSKGRTTASASRSFSLEDDTLNHTHSRAHSAMASGAVPSSLPQASTGAFHAYLRSLNDPFVAATTTDTSARAAALPPIMTYGIATPPLTSDAEQQTTAPPPPVSNAHENEWEVRPGTTHNRARTPTATPNAPETNRRDDNNPSKPQMPAGSGPRRARTPFSSSASNASIATRDSQRVRELREAQQHLLSHRESQRLRREIEQALGVLQDAEKALFLFTTTTAPVGRSSRKRSASDGEEAGSGSDVGTSLSGKRDSDEQDTRRYRVDALAFERVGQLQRTLKALQPQHFQAVADTVGVRPASRATRGPNVLLELVASLLNTLTSLSHLSLHATALTPAVVPHCLQPRFSSSSRHAAHHGLHKSAKAAHSERPESYVYLPGLLPPPHVESMIRNSGLLFALREVCRVLVAKDNETWSSCMAHVLTNGTITQRSSSTQPWLALRGMDVFAMLDAALALPSDDALRVQALVPTARATHAAPSSSSSSSSSSATTLVVWQPVQVALEEWCVHRWLYFQTLVVHVLETTNKEHNRSGAASSSSAQGSTTPRAAKAAELVAAQLPAWLRQQSLSVRHWIAILRTCMSAIEDPSNLMLRATTTTTSTRSRAGRGAHGAGSPRPDRQTLRIPYGVGKEMTILLLRFLKARTELVRDVGVSSSSSTSSTTHSSSESMCLDDLHVRDVATLCAAVLFFDVLTTEALHVLVQAAPRCVADADILRGGEVADMLLAYATLKFNGNVVLHGSERGHSQETVVNFYITLGTRAGQLGDTLSVEDTTRVLRALEMIGIEHETLRKSFESSLRMRSVTRRQHLV